MAGDFYLGRHRDRLCRHVHRCSTVLEKNGPLCTLPVCPARETLGIRSHLSFSFPLCPCSHWTSVGGQTLILSSCSPCVGSVRSLLFVAGEGGVSGTPVSTMARSSCSWHFTWPSSVIGSRNRTYLEQLQVKCSVRSGHTLLPHCRE